METMNSQIMLIVIGLTMLVLVGGGLLFTMLLGKTRKETQAKLDRFKARFVAGARGGPQSGRSIRVGQEETGLAGILADMMPKKEELQARLVRAGLTITLGRYAMICGGIAIGTLLVALILGINFVLALGFGVVAGVGGPHFVVGIMMKRRIGRFTDQFPEAIDLMVRGLRSGLPVNECIANIGRELTAPTGTEFQRIADSMRVGRTLEDALWDTANRLDTAEFKFFVISLVVQRETGGNLGETLANLGGILRQRHAMKLKIKALSSEAKASAWIVGLLPFIMFGLLMTVNAGYAMELFINPKGTIALIAGLVWMGVGVFIMARMVNFEV
ncbi:type II secretion system F family protein [Gimibacter soli]|uniref:Type II secretion system F family protein n=1 Tax=Gimibacter soli TaxID=3024400 RepID=A0AAF0BMV6_9PROT|nr:type II secretion system F family protein [Gimibacter soli]WCL55051.1 type II secretion system F family protein [Gimibacter soli]